MVIVDEQTNTLVEHRRLGTAEDLAEDVLPSKIRDRRGRRGPGGADRQPLADVPAPVLACAVADDAGRRRPADGHRSVVRGTFACEEDGYAAGAPASQGAIAIENARMHRLITKQASTDGLTGLNQPSRLPRAAAPRDRADGAVHAARWR